MKSCTETPISWLDLERYELGELDEADRMHVAAHLSDCDVCSACLETIQGDSRALVPLTLPTMESKPLRASGSPHASGASRELGELARSNASNGSNLSPASPARGASRAWPAVLRRAIPVAGALAMAAVVLLFFRSADGPNRPQGGIRSGGDQIKGNETGFALVRDDEGTITEAGGTYRDGDRFKALVSCPPEGHASFDLVVYEGAEASFPLEPQSDFRCGNAVPMRGAFRVTGDGKMTVCLVWNDDRAVDRAEISRTPPALLARAHCKVLEPVR